MAPMIIRSSGPMSPLTKFFLRRILPWPFLLGGVGALFFGVREVIRAHASNDWPTVPGVVRESSAQWRGNGRRAKYYARLRYTYVLEGSTHSGSRVDYDANLEGSVDVIVRHYPVGKEVTVHYMPGDPDECVLEPGMGMSTFAVPLMGFIFTTMGILMFIFLPMVFPKVDRLDD